MSLLQTISFFPYNSWWRLGGKPELKNQLGGICTLVLLGLVGYIFVFKLVEVFNKTKMTVSSSFQQQYTQKQSNLTTFQNDSSLYPFMLAIDFSKTADYGLDSTDFVINAQYSVVNQSSSDSQKVSFQLQACTQYHVSSNVSNNNLDYKASLCLPSNRIYQFDSSNPIQIAIYCQTDACQDNNETLIFYLYMLQSSSNPYNKTDPVAVYLYNQAIYFGPNFYHSYDPYLNLNNIITDDSLHPLQTSIKESKFFSFDENVRTFQMPSSTSTTIINHINKSKEPSTDNIWMINEQFILQQQFSLQFVEYHRLESRSKTDYNYYPSLVYFASLISM